MSQDPSYIPPHIEDIADGTDAVAVVPGVTLPGVGNVGGGAVPPNPLLNSV